MMNLRTRGDLVRLVEDATAESLVLEFKAAAALSRTSEGRSELVKDVSALANSAGGQIIYGVKEGGGVASALDEPGVQFNAFTAEWMGQVVESNTSPRIPGIEIRAIPYRDGAGAYVVSVPQSTTLAPHQNVMDKKYYKRFEQRAVPMHDYEIRDTLRRGDHPEIDVRLTFFGGGMAVDRPESGIVPLIVEIENLGSEPSLYTSVQLQLDRRLAIRNAGSWRLHPGLASFGGVGVRQLSKLLMVPTDFPLFKGSHLTLGPPDIEVFVPSQMDGGFMIRAVALAHGCVKEMLHALSCAHGRLALSRIDLETVRPDGMAAGGDGA